MNLFQNMKREGEPFCDQHQLLGDTFIHNDVYTWHMTGKKWLCWWLLRSATKPIKVSTKKKMNLKEGWKSPSLSISLNFLRNFHRWEVEWKKTFFPKLFFILIGNSRHILWIFFSDNWSSLLQWDVRYV